MNCQCSSGIGGEPKQKESIGTTEYQFRFKEDFWFLSSEDIGFAWNSFLPIDVGRFDKENTEEKNEVWDAYLS